MTPWSFPLFPPASPSSNCRGLLPWAHGLRQVGPGRVRVRRGIPRYSGHSTAMVVPILSCQHHGVQRRQVCGGKWFTHLRYRHLDYSSMHKLQYNWGSHLQWVRPLGLWKVKMPGLAPQPLARALHTGLAFGRKWDLAALGVVFLAPVCLHFPASICVPEGETSNRK